MNQLQKINKIKKEILEIQIKKLGKITYYNLIKLQYKNNDLLQELKIKEQEKNLYTPIIEKYNNDKKILEKKYNLKNTLELLEKDYNNKYKTQIDTFHKKIKVHQTNINTYSEQIITSNRVQIDILIHDLFQKEDYNKILKSNINILQQKINNKNKICEEQLESINDKYKKRMDKYVCDTPLNGGQAIKQCQIQFLKKYYIYLKQFYDLCNKYGTDENIPESCILFTDEQVESQIKILDHYNSKFNEEDYKIDETSFKKDFMIKIEKKKEYYKKKLDLHNKILEDSLYIIKKIETIYKNSVNNENKKTITEINNKITKLDYEITNNKETYKVLNSKYNYSNKNCNQKKNEMIYEKMNMFLEKKKCRLK